MSLEGLNSLIQLESTRLEGQHSNEGAMASQQVAIDSAQAVGQRLTHSISKQQQITGAAANSLSNGVSGCMRTLAANAFETRSRRTPPLVARSGAVRMERTGGSEGSNEYALYFAGPGDGAVVEVGVMIQIEYKELGYNDLQPIFEGGSYLQS